MFLFNLRKKPETKKKKGKNTDERLFVGAVRKFLLECLRCLLWEEISYYFSLCSVNIDYHEKLSLLIFIFFLRRWQENQHSELENLLRYNLIIIHFWLVTGNEFAFLFPFALGAPAPEEKRFIYRRQSVLDSPSSDPRTCIVRLQPSEKSTLLSMAK